MSKYGPAWVWPATGQGTSPSPPSRRQKGRERIRKQGPLCPQPQATRVQGWVCRPSRREARLPKAGCGVATAPEKGKTRRKQK